MSERAQPSAASAPSFDHGLGRYTNHGCRCAICRREAAAYVRKRRADRLSAPIPEYVHGTDNGYTNYACRCELCKQARRLARAKARAAAAD
jgi:hypothetical protein